MYQSDERRKYDGIRQAAWRLSALYQPIEDYGVIGDGYTIALVGESGSIDWCCFPRFASPRVL
jgi:GH15 family glucan-1,4-alpha-glucosidase